MGAPSRARPPAVRSPRRSPGPWSRRPSPGSDAPAPTSGDSRIVPAGTISSPEHADPNAPPRPPREAFVSQQRRLPGERYRVENSIGRGGMAQVYRGTDTVLNRTVAIKVLGPQYAQDQAFVERFRREAQAAARLNHPNVVSVYDTG